MSAILIDSNVLLDVLTRDVQWYFWSRDAIEQATNRYRLAINAIIYAEVSVHFSRIEELNAVLPMSVIDREAIPFDAAFLAGRAFLSYRRRGGVRRSPLPDFFIGAHATVSGYQLLTRDAARYRTYFPKLKLITPG